MAISSKRGAGVGASAAEEAALMMQSTAPQSQTNFMGLSFDL